MVGANITNYNSFVENKDVLTCVQFFTHNIKSSSKEPAWSDENIKDMVSTMNCYSHSVYTVVIGKIYTPMLFAEHYRYACERGIKGYIIHLNPSNKFGNTVEFLSNMLAKFTKYNKDIDYSQCIIYFEHIPKLYPECNFFEISNIVSLLKKIKTNMKLGICIDTCHMYVSGLDVENVSFMEQYMNELVNTGYPLLVHLNDSQEAKGSCRDIHAAHGTTIWKENTDSLAYIVGFCKNNNIDCIVELKDYRSSIDLDNSL